MNRFASAFSALTVLGMAGAAHAAVVTLTGGDAGEELVLDPARVVNATNFTGAANVTVQGVVFSRTTPAYTVLAARNNGTAGGTPAGTGFTGNGAYVGFSTTAGSNDANLKLIADTLSFQAQGTNGGVQGFTLTGLTVGQQYTLDVILSTSSFAGRSQTVSIGGSVVDTVTMASNVVYDSVQTVTATATTLTVSLAPTGPGTQDGTVLNGVVVQAVPEPATLGLLGLGSVALLRRRRA